MFRDHQRRLAITTALISIVCLACSRPTQPTMRPLHTPMRDGVVLAADLHLPSDSGPYPVILLRTPYNKALLAEYGTYYSDHGYAVVIQDVRGRFASQGEWQPFLNEARDGYDTVEWIAAQDWSTGKIGMVGGSYSGTVQYAAAIEKPPHLTTIIPNITPAIPFDNLPYERGVLQLGWAIRWIDIMENARIGREIAAKLEAARRKDWSSDLGPLPVRDLDRRIVGKEVGYWREWLEHNTNDGYWTRARYLERLTELEIPVFVQSGWFDPGTRGSKLAYGQLEVGGTRHRRLVIGPWSHSDRGGRFLAGQDMGAAADIDLRAEYRDWFDRWLRSAEGAVDSGPSVELYLMGSNRWLTGPTYPLPGTEMVPFHLAGPDDSTSPGVDGSLKLGVPSDAPAAHDAYVYDPRQPTPSPFAAMKRGEFASYASRSLERPDLLIYETAPLTESVHLAGPIELTLFAASSAVDTDWGAALYAVDADGEAYPVGLTFGMLRARFRDSTSKPRLLDPGAVYEYEIDLGHTAITVPAGHRLRLEIASASFPEYSRNLNTGGHSEMETELAVAEQIIHYGGLRPSRVQLPVIDISSYR